MPIEKSVVEGWLRDIGLNPRPANNPQFAWQFEFAYPINTGHMMTVFAPRDRPRAIVVATGVKIDDAHLRTFDSLDEDTKVEFLNELVRALNHDYVEFATRGAEGEKSCPRFFEVMATRFDDGLSLDSFARSVSSAYKVELAGTQCVQRYLGGQGFSGGDRFDFRRVGL